jgi:8-oxo-dGTP diphosphatase
MERTRAAIGLVWRGGRLAVGRRAGAGPLAGFDEFPGGKCRPGEDPQDAVVREVLEETGLAVRVVGLRARVEHDYEHAGVELFFFDCEPIGDEGSSGLQAPFEWWEVDRVRRGRFPEANRSVLASLRGPLGG